MEIRFRWLYRLFNAQARPSVCLCLVRSGDVGGLGVAICSKSDNASYRRGRDIAFARARYAMEKLTEPNLPVERIEAQTIIDGSYAVKKSGEETMAPIVHYKAVPSRWRFFDETITEIWPRQGEPRPAA